MTADGDPHRLPLVAPLFLSPCHVAFTIPKFGLDVTIEPFFTRVMQHG